MLYRQLPEAVMWVVVIKRSRTTCVIKLNVSTLIVNGLLMFTCDIKVTINLKMLACL